MNFDREKFGFDFVKHRNKYFIFSGSLILVGIIVLALFGLNLSVDFEGGTRVEILIENEDFTADEINAVFAEIGFQPGETRIAGNQNEYAVALFPGALNKEEMDKIEKAFIDKYGPEVGLSEITVSAGIARELARSAIIAVLLASVGIVIYVSIRFEYRFGISAIIALLHVAFFVITVFSILRLSVDLTFIAAILTAIGYSINDTIVIFDRIRENMKTAKLKTLTDLRNLVNRSIVDSLARSINTSLTMVFVAGALYLFGGESIRNFSFALLVGVIIGTYSSIFIASQIWYVWKSKEIQKASSQSTN